MRLYETCQVNNKNTRTTSWRVDFEQVNVSLVNDSNEMPIFYVEIYVPFSENVLVLCCIYQRYLLFFFTERFSLSACSLCNCLLTLHVFLIFNRFNWFKVK